MTMYRLGDLTPTPPADGDYWIAPGAHVIGNVVIGSGVGIWFGATLRGDNEVIDIGDGTNVQENTVMHTDLGFPLVIGKNCTIGHKVMLHGCTIGNNSLIGMGATILNGAKIGNNCLIGAGALVTENKVIPDGSLVMGIEPHDRLFELPPGSVFALTIDPSKLMEIRQHRLAHLGVLGSGEYADAEHVFREVRWALNLFRNRGGWPIIDVTNLAVEETASEILNLRAQIEIERNSEEDPARE